MNGRAVSREFRLGIYILCSFLLVLTGSSLIREKTFENDYPYLRIGGDAASYIAMAEGSAEPVAAPFRYRIVFPLIASLFDAPTTSVFRLINFAALFFFYLIAFLICERRKFPPGISVVAVVFVFLSPWHLYIYQNPFIADGIVQLLMMAVLYAVMTKNLWLYVVAAAVGVGTHERILFLLPLWLLTHDKRQGVIVLLSIIALYSGMRVMIGDGIGTIAHGSFSGMALFATPLIMVKDALVGSTPLYLIALTGLFLLPEKEMIDARPIVAVYLIASIIPALVATDTGRMLIGFSPAALFLAASFFSAGRFTVWISGVLLCTLFISLAYIPITMVPIPEWLLYRKFVIAGSFILLFVCYGRIVLPLAPSIKASAAKLLL
jgi:hypothetical protein